MFKRQFQDPTLSEVSVASTSELHTPAMFALSIAGNYGLMFFMKIHCFKLLGKVTG